MSPLLILAAALGIGGTVVNHEVRNFERKAASDIAAQLSGDQKFVHVKTKQSGPLGPLFTDVAKATIYAKDFRCDGLPLFTEPERNKQGILRELNIELDNFEMRGLRIEALRAKIPDCRFDKTLALRKRQIRLSRSGVGEGWVRVSQGALEPWILANVREIKEVKVKLRDGKAWVEGYGEFLVATTRFVVVADLIPVNSTQIVLSNANVIFGYRKADELAKKAILDALNPVVDLKKDLDLLDTFALQRIELKEGRMTAYGKTKIPTLPPRTGPKS